MKIAFRVDASVHIGSGHVMRCLTLAKALRDVGANCRFVCRDHPGNMIGYIRNQGFHVAELPKLTANFENENTKGLVHESWLGAHWKTDSEQTKAALEGVLTDWLIVDHYALDIGWEKTLRSSCNNLLVIDDLADRKHDCDLLLDQNLVANMAERYTSKVPERCVLLLGPRYALVRPEFGQIRSASLKRRSPPNLQRLLIFLGGSDAENETSKVIRGVRMASRQWQHIDVVVGSSFVALDELRQELTELSSITLHIQTAEMAELMLNSDLAVTAGGSVTWEKCTLGLPSLVVIQGDNQYPIATNMHLLGAQRTVGLASKLTPANYAQALDAIQLNELSAMTESAKDICDGSGATAVLRQMSILL